MTDTDNPYASPSMEASSGAPEAPVSETEMIRRRHIGAETSIRAIGGLLFIACLPPALIAFGGARRILGYDGIQESNWINVIILIASVALAVGLFILAFGLRRFRALARIPGAVTIILMLAGTFALAWRWWLFTGTIAAVEIYVIYLLLSKKGQFVFSREYAAVRHQTPHIRYRATGLASLMLVVIFVLLVLGMFAPAIR